MKLVIVSSVLLIHVVSVFSVYLKSVELGEVKLEPLHNIYSNHIPQYIEPLNLTTGELKVFAGHGFQLLKAKCPAVSQERLGLISKYIAKLISRNNPQPGSSATFKDLITSISTCTQHELTDEEREQRDMSFFRFFFHPFRSIGNLFGYGDATANKDTTGQASTAVPPDTLQLDAEPEPQVINLKDGNKIPSFDKDDDDDEKVVPTSSVSPVLTDDIDAADSPIAPVIRVFYTTGDDAQANNWNRMGWVGGVFNAIRNFISSMFGGPAEPEDSDDLAIASTIAPEVLRVKRDAETTAPKEPVEKIDIRETEVIEKETIITTHKGRESFMSMIDNMCRVYCAECVAPEQVRNFKAAAKELLQVILTDSTGMELAAKHFLEPDFLKSLNDC